MPVAATVCVARPLGRRSAPMSLKQRPEFPDPSCGEKCPGLGVSDLSRQYSFLGRRDCLQASGPQDLSDKVGEAQGGCNTAVLQTRWQRAVKDSDVFIYIYIVGICRSSSAIVLGHSLI